VIHADIIIVILGVVCSKTHAPGGPLQNWPTTVGGFAFSLEFQPEDLFRFSYTASQFLKCEVNVSIFIIFAYLLISQLHFLSL